MRFEPEKLLKGHVRTPKNHSNGPLCSMPPVVKSLCCNIAIAAYVREGYGQVVRVRLKGESDSKEGGKRKR